MLLGTAYKFIKVLQLQRLLRNRIKNMLVHVAGNPCKLTLDAPAGHGGQCNAMWHQKAKNRPLLDSGLTESTRNCNKRFLPYAGCTLGPLSPPPRSSEEREMSLPSSACAASTNFGRLDEPPKRDQCKSTSRQVGACSPCLSCSVVA